MRFNKLSTATLAILSVSCLTEESGGNAYLAAGVSSNPIILISLGTDLFN